MKKIKENFNELLFSYYIFSFSLLGRVIPNYSQISTYVLIANIAFVIIASLLGNKFRIKIKVQELALYSMIALLFLIDYHFRYNQYTIQTYIYLCIFAIIPVYLFLRVKNKENMIKIYSYLSIFIAIGYIFDPFQNYKYSGDYMGFGYNIMIYVFIGLYIGTKNGGILFKVLTVVAIAEMLFFANKGAFVSAVIFVFLYEFFIYNNKKQPLKKIVLMLIVIILTFNLNWMIDKVYQYTIENNIESYSIRTLYKMVNNSDSGLAGRENIWEDAKEQIEKNILFGNGVGYFRSLSEEGIYTHNVVYDLLIEYGFFIFALIFMIVLKGCIKLIKDNSIERLVGLIFLCMWFPKLFFSSNFESTIGFGLFIIWSLTRIKEGEKNESKKFNT